MKQLFISSAIALLTTCIACFETKAQVTLSAQLRTRSEFRDGQGAPLPKGAPSAFFTSQRSRINLLFNRSRLKLNFTLQDVRVWGQDVSSINRVNLQENNSLLTHEAWAEILLSDTAIKTKAFSLKIGRQELVYDDQRLLGNLDWLQQGRRHDAAVLKYETPKWLLHAGGAFNQNKEAVSGIVYNNSTPTGYAATTNGGAMYKSMEFLYAQKKLNKGALSFLFFADQFNQYNNDTISGVAQKKYLDKVWSRATTGFYFTKAFGNANITASTYYQFGTNAVSQKVDAHMANLSLLYTFGKLTAGPGVDYTSGSTTNAGRAFDPLYGTPHKFWGLMDYFYAASSFGKGGLLNYYVKSKYAAGKNVTLTADAHLKLQITTILTDKS
jgi:hypothetical protein